MMKNIVNPIFIAGVMLLETTSARSGEHSPPTTVQSAHSASGQKLAAKKEYPDWSGVWENTTGFLYTKPGGKDNPPPLSQEYAEKYKKTLEMAASGTPINDPTAQCIWPGMPRLMIIPYPSEWEISPTRVLFLSEYMSQVRRIWTDGRSHPEDLDASYNGHSIGHWEGKTLVAETVGLRSDTMYQNTGLQHSDVLTVRERIQLIEPDVLEDEVTAVDPKGLVKPWTTKIHYRRRRDWQIMEFVCDENNRNPVDANGQTITLDDKGKPLKP